MTTTVPKRIDLDRERAAPKPPLRSTGSLRPAARPLAFLMGAVACISPAVADIGSALELVPRDAIGAFIVPSLKRLSDDLSTCLERVDRAEALLVGRPIDLAKSRMGIGGGVRDDGAMLGVLRRGDGATPIATLLVPVTDAEAFLGGSFDRESVPGLVRRPGGPALHAATVVRGDRRWVALSESKAGVDGLHADPAAAAHHRARLGSAAERLLVNADVVAWLDGAAVVLGLDQGIEQGRAAVAGGPALAAAERVRRLAESIDVAAFAWDVDALGLLGRSVLRLRPESELGLALGRPRTGAAATNLLGRLPDVMPYLAVGIDIAAFGGIDGITALAALVGVPAETVASWGVPKSMRQVQFAVYPSRLGVAVGGALNDAALVVVDDDPAASKAALLSRIEGLAGEAPGVRRDVAVERGRAVKDAGIADAFEIRETALPGGDPQALAIWAMFRSILFGSRGLHGLAGNVTDAVVMTFSQRPDVWRRAIEAAGGAGRNGLGGGDVVVAMREYGLDGVDIEAICGVAQLGRLAAQIAATIPGGAGAVPVLDAGSEPIYAALRLEPAEIHGAVVVPSGIVGVAVDFAKRSQIGR
ncbi:MAG TPA: hypothetical protein PKC43_00030 [Phycisphaerales bacterium]|nr:hypothetical protein [Phycisphaerales bacterium]HMP35811.1 hypothetical protein [Phycisphaerales bacterium]